MAKLGWLRRYSWVQSILGALVLVATRSAVAQGDGSTKLLVDLGSYVASRDSQNQSWLGDAGYVVPLKSGRISSEAIDSEYLGELSDGSFLSEQLRNYRVWSLKPNQAFSQAIKIPCTNGSFSVSGISAGLQQEKVEYLLIIEGQELRVSAGFAGATFPPGAVGKTKKILANVRDGELTIGIKAIKGSPYLSALEVESMDSSRCDALDIRGSEIVSRFSELSFSSNPYGDKGGVLRIDYGSEAPTVDKNGHTWLPDLFAMRDHYFNGQSLKRGRLADSLSSHPLRKQLATIREGVRRLQIPMPLGSYLTTIHLNDFDEFVRARGVRIFDIFITGVGDLGEYDLFEATEKNRKPVSVSTKVKLETPMLEIIFPKEEGWPTIAALEIARLR